jgi:hypothetical protein
MWRRTRKPLWEVRNVAPEGPEDQAAAKTASQVLEQALAYNQRRLDGVEEELTEKAETLWRLRIEQGRLLTEITNYAAALERLKS